MLRVKSCFCYWSLEFGFLAFAVVSLLFRISLSGSLLLFRPEACELEASRSTPSEMGDYEKALISTPYYKSAGGWYSVTSAFLVLAIYGIFQKRSIHVFPYIVVLITEIIIVFAVSSALSALISPFITITIFIVGFINTYAVICLISLYLNIKEYEENSVQRASNNIPI